MNRKNTGVSSEKINCLTKSTKQYAGLSIILLQKRLDPANQQSKTFLVIPGLYLLTEHKKQVTLVYC